MRWPTCQDSVKLDSPMPIHPADQYRPTESLMWKKLSAEWNSLPADRQWLKA